MVVSRIINCVDEGVASVLLPKPFGRGVIATRDFQPGEFVLEYSGEYVPKPSREEIVARLKKYVSEYGDTMEEKCYIFDFVFQERMRW